MSDRQQLETSGYAHAAVRPAERKATAVRAEIQALRAVAVLTVVIFHVWPDALPGGYVGVDVFFAISGYLITSHLLREVQREGRLSLWRFWARRMRRLLPASLLTLLACAIATIVFVPELYWQQWLTEIFASTAYVQNWQLASDAVDYLGAANQPSPVQHFWSLSAEEQFYIIWPVLILLAALATRAGTWRAKRAAITIVLGAVTVASLVYSITETAANPAAAYFITPTRAWEFGAGGLLALAGQGGRLPAAVRTTLSWAGLIAIVVAASTYSSETPFPSWTALLPVLGALAVMHAGLPQTAWAPTPALKLAPVQFLGDISYSVYLWHWPLIVLAPFVIRPGLTETRIAVITTTIVAAWLTKLIVEDPVRRSRFLTAGRPPVTFATMAVATALVLAVPAAGYSHAEAEIEKAERQSVKLVASKPACFGAAAREPRNPCDNSRLRLQVVPRPIEARAEKLNAPCSRFRRNGVINVCHFGTREAQATRTIALVGDSHASHWRGALDVVADEKSWHGQSITRTSCPYSKATRVIPEPERSDCQRWRKALPRYLRKHPEIDTLFVVAMNRGKVNVPPGRTEFEAKVNGYRNGWETLPDSVKHIIVIRDTPKVSTETMDCVEQAIADRKRAGLACALNRVDALGTDPAVAAARQVHSGRVQVVDLNRWLCSPRLCFPVIGGALVYKDLHHFTFVFAKTLGAPLLAKIDRLEATW